MGFLLVFLGAGLGGALRHATNLLFARTFTLDYPYATLFINVSGSVLMGVIAGYFALRGEAPQAACLLLTTGVLGGFTTFSAFSLDAALLYERGQLAAASAYVLGSVFLSVLGLFAGLFLIRQLP